jgi:hypothetical protein
MISNGCLLKSTNDTRSATSQKERNEIESNPIMFEKYTEERGLADRCRKNESTNNQRNTLPLNRCIRSSAED